MQGASEKAAYWAAYKAAHEEEIRAYQKAYAAARSEQMRAYLKTYRATHKERVRARQKAYEAAHRDERRAYEAEYRAAHKEEYRAQKRAWTKTPRGRAKRAAEDARRRASGYISPKTVVALREEAHGICPYCYGPIETGHLDHIVPIASGGTNERDNLIWCCGVCNMRKGSRSLLQYLIPLHEKNGAWVR
jgi:5-methylcytosine-specific restriction endonuclease McrA